MEEFPNTAENPEGELSLIQQEMKKLAAERDSLFQELTRIKTRRKVDELAVRYNFTDPDYLEYLCKERELLLDSEEESGNFMSELQGRMPKFFRLEMVPGIPEAAGLESKSSAAGHNAGADSLIRMLQDAPDLN